MDAAVEKKIREFYAGYPQRKLRERQVIVHQDDMPPGVFLLEHGSIRQYTIDYRGNEIVVNIFQPLSFLPLLCAFNKEPSKYFFETSEPSTVRTAPQKDVLAFIKDNPDVSYDLLTRLYSGLDGVLMRMVHLMSGTAYTRILHELIVQTQRQHNDQAADITLSLKEYQIGTYCGLTRETVSREFKKLKERKLVSVVKQGLIVHDLSALEAELTKHTK